MWILYSKSKNVAYRLEIGEIRLGWREYLPCCSNKLVSQKLSFAPKRILELIWRLYFWIVFFFNCFCCLFDISKVTDMLLSITQAWYYWAVWLISLHQNAPQFGQNALKNAPQKNLAKMCSKIRHRKFFFDPLVHFYCIFMHQFF